MSYWFEFQTTHIVIRAVYFNFFVSRGQTSRLFKGIPFDSLEAGSILWGSSVWDGDLTVSDSWCPVCREVVISGRDRLLNKDWFSNVHSAHVCIASPCQCKDEYRWRPLVKGQVHDRPSSCCNRLSCIRSLTIGTDNTAWNREWFWTETFWQLAHLGFDPRSQ